jgi:hypothetical protein
MNREEIFYWTAIILFTAIGLMTIFGVFGEYPQELLLGAFENLSNFY